MQLLDVHFPTTEGRELTFTRYTEPESDQELLLAKRGGHCRRRPRHASRLQSSRRDVVQTFDPALFAWPADLVAL